MKQSITTFLIFKKAFLAFIYKLLNHLKHKKSVNLHALYNRKFPINPPISIASEIMMPIVLIATG
ncbi:MAG: hypothetical protein RR520_02340 [Erysipelotrichaceae bacterium]